MLIRTLTIAAVLVASPLVVEAKKLKPKYYKSCYADYAEMRELVPGPPLDIAKSAKTIGAVAGIAGRFGGFGGLGSAASTASTVAKYSETIADVAEFTQNMTAQFPESSDRYLAYGERMGTEAAEMERVAEFSLAAQECYAGAYASLKKAETDGKMKPREVKKRHKEIKQGVTNVGELLSDATQYMDTNINAYNEAMTMETTGAGLNLTSVLSLVSQAQSVTTQVQSLTPVATGDINVDQLAGRKWMPPGMNLDGHRTRMVAHYQSLGVTLPDDFNQPTAAEESGLFGNIGSLTSLAQLGSVGPTVAAQVALAQAQVNAGNALMAEQAEASEPVVSMPDNRVVALAQAGEDVQPYLASYQRVRALTMMHGGVESLVSEL